MTSLLLGTPVSGYQRECLLSVQSSASALLTIVNDILDLSKIASGHVRLDPAPLALRTLLQRVTAPFAAGARERAAADDHAVAYRSPNWALQ